VTGSESGKQLKVFGRVGALGIELAVSTVIGLLAGRWLDHKLSTGPYLMLVGLILGVVAGFRSVYRSARQQMKDIPPYEPEAPPEPPEPPEPQQPSEHDHE